MALAHIRSLLARYSSMDNRFAVIGTVSHESFKWRLDLIEEIRHGGGVANFRRGQFARYYLMFLVDGKMQFAPRAPRRNVMFFLVPFIFSVDLESGAVDDDDATWLHSLAQNMLRRINAALGNGTVVRNSNSCTHHSSKRNHETFSLT